VPKAAFGCHGMVTRTIPNCQGWLCNLYSQTHTRTI